jgi:predicted transglutaminase-like cysteine proteinase
MKFSDLQAINFNVNNMIQYKPDMETYGRSEEWAIAETVGDCEDYALRKLHELLALGWPLEKLRLATCWVENNLGYHAVLVVTDVENDDGYIGNYVLDNRFMNIYQPETQTSYTWDKIQQTGGSATWVKFY